MFKIDVSCSRFRECIILAPRMLAAWSVNVPLSFDDRRSRSMSVLQNRQDKLSSAGCGQLIVPITDHGQEDDPSPIPMKLALGITRDDLFENRRDRTSRACNYQKPYRRLNRQRINNTYGLRLLRTKLLGPSSDGASSEDVLTMLLCNALAEPIAREMAQHLLKTFGSLKSIFGADEGLLITHCGGNEECVDLVFGYYLLMRTALREPFESQPILSSMTALHDYLLLTTNEGNKEVFRTLFMNGHNMLLKDEVISRGTVNHVPVYTREVVKRTLEVGATAVLLVHNHPSGHTSPSRDDIEMTNRLYRCLSDINVILHDHIIVGRHTCQSMRDLGLIPSVPMNVFHGVSPELAASRRISNRINRGD